MLQVEHICAGYGKKEILHDISFSVRSHTLTALLGANGCGKTTLLKSIANQLPHKGTCILNEDILEQQQVKQLARKISYMPQKSGLTISLPVLEVVLMGFNPVLKLLERPSKAQKELAREALRKVGLETFENQDYLTLSEGQKQLVFLARTFIEDTSLLLLDEPDSALDFKNRYSILNQFKQLVQSKQCVGMLCLHDPMLALEFCDYLVLIKDGNCIGVIQPKVDSIEQMERLLQEIYGEICLTECFDKNKKRHLIVTWNGGI